MPGGRRLDARRAVATHAAALLVAAWPFDGPAAAWSEAARPGSAGGGRRSRWRWRRRGYWLYARATPLVLALAPWAGVGAAAAAQARAPGTRRGPHASAPSRPGERVAAATTGARGLAPFATLTTFALVCVKA